LIGWLAVLVIAGFLVSVAVRFVPHYLSFHAVKSTMDDLAADPAARSLRRNEALSRIARQLRMNGIDSVTPRDFGYERVSGGYELSVEYEAREHLLGNLDAIMTFGHRVRIAAP
jgi:hypothetical protein